MKRPTLARIAHVEAKRPRVDPAPIVADGAGPVPQAALDVLAKMLARGLANATNNTKERTK